MAKVIKVYFDKEGDFLEVLFSDEAGFVRDTDHPDVMERVSNNGELLGFTVNQVRQHENLSPLVVELA